MRILSAIVYRMTPIIARFHRPRPGRAAAYGLPAAISALLLLAGCSSAPTAARSSVRTCKGSATIVTVDPYMRDARARWSGRTITLWWDRTTVFYRQGKRIAAIPAKPGQKMNFDGLLADGDIYLGRAWVGPPPPPFGGLQPFIQQGRWPKSVVKPKKLPPGKLVSPGSSAGVPQSLRQ